MIYDIQSHEDKNVASSYFLTVTVFKLKIFPKHSKKVDFIYLCLIMEISLPMTKRLTWVTVFSVFYGAPCRKQNF